MRQQGSLMPRLRSDVFCHCRAAEKHPGVDPGGGEETSEAPRSAADCHPSGSHSPQPCASCAGSEQEHRRMKVLFQILDVNGDGGICVNDLTIGLKKLGVHRSEHDLMVSRHSAAPSHSFPCFCPAASLHPPRSLTTFMSWHCSRAR